MAGARYRRSLFPGLSDTAESLFRCPGVAEGGAGPTQYDRDFKVPIPKSAPEEIWMVARPLYRKIDQYLINFMFGEQSGLTTPVIETARAEATIAVRVAGGTSGAGAP